MVPPLTFGVELEFSLACLDSSDSDPHPDDPRTSFGPDTDLRDVKRALGKAFKEAGLSCARLNPETQWEISTDITVSPDYSHDRKVREKYRWYGMEIKSPVLYFCEDTLQMVRVACLAIVNNFRTRCFTGSGLHVHVGNGTKSFPLHSVKMLAAFLYTFSPQIDSLHTRRNVTWAWSIREESLLSKSCPTVTSALNKVFAAPSFAELNLLFKSDLWLESLEYKIFRLDPAQDVFPSSKRTIEWRQAAGTLDPDYVVAWARIAVGLVDFIVNGLNVEDLMPLLWDSARREDAGLPVLPILDLFAAIGLEEEGKYWAENEDKFPVSKIWATDRARRRLREESEQASKTQETNTAESSVAEAAAFSNSSSLETSPLLRYGRYIITRPPAP